MLHLGIAISAFILSHLAPAIPGVREGLTARLGRRTYIILYSLLSTAMLVWVIGAALHAPVVLLWQPAGWQAWVTVLLSPLALFLVIAGLLSPNPVSLTFFPRHTERKGAIVLITRHPVLWGALLWAISHIPPNGDVRSLLLFSVLAALAASGFWLSDRRAKRKHGPEWNELVEQTSILPFAATLAGRNRLRVDSAIVIALLATAMVTYWMLMGGHAALFGADPLAATRY